MACDPERGLACRRVPQQGIQAECQCPSMDRLPVKAHGNQQRSARAYCLGPRMQRNPASVFRGGSFLLLSCCTAAA